MKPYLLLAAVVLAGILPFASRAVYLDEHIYLHLAQSAQTNPLFPQDTPLIFFGVPRANFASHTHPPVGEYYLAVLYSILGRFSEVPFRLLFSIFPIGAVFGFYALAKRFTAHPLWVALLFAASPAFFVYSPTLMMDIPMLAFLLAGFALYFGYIYDPRQSRINIPGGHRPPLQGIPQTVAAVHERSECKPDAKRKRDSAQPQERAQPSIKDRRGYRKFEIVLPLASLCFILAAGTGYTALVPLGCFFLGLLAAGRPLKELVCVAAAPFALALWLAAMTLHFGEFPLTATVGYFVARGSISQNLLAVLSFIGTVGVFPWLAGTKKGAAAVVAIIIATLLTFLVPWPSIQYRLWFVLLASSGLAVLMRFAAAARALIASGRNAGEAFLILWVPATLLFFIVVGDMINARYILLVLPALYLVIFRETTRKQLIYKLIPTAMLSLALAYADFSFVNSYRTWVNDTVVPLQQQGFRVWSGAESGLRFYLEQHGIESLTATDLRPGPTDLIVRHELYRYEGPLLMVLKSFTLNNEFPIRTYNAAAGAGFHDSSLGLVPFTFSRAPFDRIEVAEFSPLPGAVWSPKGPIFTQTEPDREFPMKIPANTKIEYELEGDGAVASTPGWIRLIKGPSPAIVWRNFRIVPKQFQ